MGHVASILAKSLGSAIISLEIASGPEKKSKGVRPVLLSCLLGEAPRQKL